MTKEQPLLPGRRAEALTKWARARRYAVPRSIIEQATQAREAGDWRTACAISNVDVEFDLAAVAREHGSEVAQRLEADLQHFAPDLLRWHLPRDGTYLTALPDTTILLASYGDTVAGGPHLSVRTPDSWWYDRLRKQRLRLCFAPRKRHIWVRAHRWWTGLRHLWDVRHTTALRAFIGGSADRPPFLEADGTPRPLGDADRPQDPALVAEKVAAMNTVERMPEAVRTVGGDPTGTTPTWRFLVEAPIALTQWATALTALRPVAEVWEVDDYAVIRFEGESLSVTTRRHWRGRQRLPRFPEAAWQRPVDLDLLYGGHLTPDDLHPLVRAALFPNLSTVDRTIGPPDPRREPVLVRCNGERHYVLPAPGGLQLRSHDDTEVARELALAGFGGTTTGCFQALRAWTHRVGRVPPELMELRYEIFWRIVHGDTAGVAAMLDAGFDPAVRDAKGRTLLHYLAHVDHRQLLPRLLAAGVEVTARDNAGNLPLQWVVRSRAEPDLIRALAAAGGAAPDDAWDWVARTHIIEAYETTDPAFTAWLRTQAGLDATSGPHVV